MTTTQATPRKLVETESTAHIEVIASASETSSGTITFTTEVMDLFDQRYQPSNPGEASDSGIDAVNVEPTPATRPRLRIMNPDRPIRYIPIHIWPEHLKKVHPRTGRKYSPKRSRTLPKRNGPSPLVREYQWTEEDGGPPCEDQGSPNTDTTQFGDCENVDRSATLPTAKRWGWGHALLGAVQNAVPKRRKEQKQPHFTFHQKTLSLPPLRFGRYPPGLKKRGSWESTKW